MSGGGEEVTVSTPRLSQPTESRGSKFCRISVPLLKPEAHFGQSLLTLVLPRFDTQMLAPSKARSVGLASTLKVP